MINKVKLIVELYEYYDELITELEYHKEKELIESDVVEKGVRKVKMKVLDKSIKTIKEEFKSMVI